MFGLYRNLLLGVILFYLARIAIYGNTGLRLSSENSSFNLPTNVKRLIAVVLIVVLILMEIRF